MRVWVMAVVEALWLQCEVRSVPGGLWVRGWIWCFAWGHTGLAARSITRQPIQINWRASRDAGMVRRWPMAPEEHGRLLPAVFPVSALLILHPTLPFFLLRNLLLILRFLRGGGGSTRRRRQCGVLILDIVDVSLLEITLVIY